MEFLDIFNGDKPQWVLETYCSRSKPGADKVNYETFSKNFQTTVESIRRQIHDEKYKFTRFEMFLKVKTHYKLPRLIFKSTLRDRLTAKLMAVYMQEFYQEKKDGPILGRTRDSVLEEISKNLKLQKENGDYKFKYFFRLDISSYFDTINRDHLILQLKDDGFDEKYIYLVKKLFFTMDLSMDIPMGMGVPQGISVSSLLAERYLYDLDAKYSKPPYTDSIYFSRYVDDIFVLTTDKVQLDSISKKILFEIQSEYGLRINDEKVQKGDLDTGEVNFLGISISKRNIGISKIQELRVEKQIDNLFLWYRRIYKAKPKSFFDLETDKIKNRALNSLIARLNLLITGYLYQKQGSNGLITGKYGWILTSLPDQLSNTDSLKKLDRHVGALIYAYIDDSNYQKRILDERKSFYKAYYKSKYKNNSDGYILDREKIEENDELMYRLTCDLSFVDLKNGLDYGYYDREAFEARVHEPLKSYFHKTLYIANRFLTDDILYW